MILCYVLWVDTLIINFVGSFGMVYAAKLQRPRTGKSEDVAIKTTKSKSNFHIS